MADFSMNMGNYPAPQPSATYPSSYQNQAVEWYSNPGGSFTYTNSYAGQPANYGTTSNFEDEPPLLEELGIDIGGILKKTRAILLHRISHKSLEDLDMGGALIYVFVLGGLHLLMGKLHFGVILGWSVVHAMVLYFITNQLAGSDNDTVKGLELYNCCCLVGYCMIPMVVYNVVALLCPRSLVLIALAIVCSVWGGLTSARILGRKNPVLEELQPLVVYPCTLLYGAFALLSVY